MLLDRQVVRTTEPFDDTRTRPPLVAAAENMRRPFNFYQGTRGETGLKPTEVTRRIFRLYTVDGRLFPGYSFIWKGQLSGDAQEWKSINLPSATINGKDHAILTPLLKREAVNIKVQDKMGRRYRRGLLGSKTKSWQLIYCSTTESIPRLQSQPPRSSIILCMSSLSPCGHAPCIDFHVIRYRFGRTLIRQSSTSITNGVGL